MNGITLYNFLIGLPVSLTTHNIGNVDSVGNVIFLAGKKRLACPNSTFMFHGVAFTGNGQYSFGERHLNEIMASVKSDETRMAKLIVSRTSLTEPQVMAMFERAATKNSDDALACGIIHEIRDVNIPQSAILVSITAN